jgi:hypothetical protein
MKTQWFFRAILALSVWAACLGLPDPAQAGPHSAAAPSWQLWSGGGRDPAHRPLRAIAMLSTIDGWAAGELGAILHWDGRAWYPASSPASTALFAFAFTSPTNGWAMGEYGVILHYTFAPFRALLPCILKSVANS